MKISCKNFCLWHGITALILCSCQHKYGYPNLDANDFYHFTYKPFFNSITSPAIKQADKIWKQAAADNNNGFYMWDNPDSIYVWTYWNKGQDNFITLNLVKPNTEIYSYTKRYPRSLEWLSDSVYQESRTIKLIVYRQKALWNEFSYLSRTKYTNLVNPVYPETIDTISIEFLKNYQRDFVEYVEPFMKRMATDNKTDNGSIK